MVQNWRPLKDTKAEKKVENRTLRCKGECLVRNTHGVHSHVVQICRRINFEQVESIEIYCNVLIIDQNNRNDKIWLMKLLKKL